MSLEQELLREFGTATFSDKTVKDKFLGFYASEDQRDWRLGEHISVDRQRGMQHWANPIQLDQGREGACCGFGTTGVINAEPAPHAFDNTFATQLYYEARRNDEWPGEDYDGTSIRAAAAVGVKWGYFSGYAFTRSVETLAHYILNYGAATIGVDWLGGMDWVDPEGYIHATGGVRGGHCVVIDGVVWEMNGEEDRFRIRNSWGRDWGLNGRCRILASDLQKLFDNGGNACCPVEVT